MMKARRASLIVLPSRTCLLHTLALVRHRHIVTSHRLIFVVRRQSLAMSCVAECCCPTLTHVTRATASLLREAPSFLSHRCTVIITMNRCCVDHFPMKPCHVILLLAKGCLHVTRCYLVILWNVIL